MIKGDQFRPGNEEGLTIEGEKDEVIKGDQSSSGKQEDNNSQQNKMIKPKNIQRFIQSPTKTPKIMNRFVTLLIEECNAIESDIQDQSDRETVTFIEIRKNQNEPEKTRMPVKKVDEKGWKRFETRNRFEALIDNTEEDVIEIIKEIQF